LHKHLPPKDIRKLRRCPVTESTGLGIVHVVTSRGDTIEVPQLCLDWMGVTIPEQSGYMLAGDLQRIAIHPHTRIHS